MYRSICSYLCLLTAVIDVVLCQATLPSGLVTGIKGNATVVDNNPGGVAYAMRFPRKQFLPTPGGPIKGAVVAEASGDGQGVTFHIKMANLPTEGGPFIYHIHTNPVPDDGNCTSTLAHLDPTERGETPACSSTQPQTCQVGDLAGKHGAITTSDSETTFSATYTDDFTATSEGDDAFIGNLSLVLHFANVTRITCGNFKMMSTKANMMSTIDSVLDDDLNDDADGEA